MYNHVHFFLIFFLHSPETTFIFTFQSHFIFENDDFFVHFSKSSELLAWQTDEKTLHPIKNHRLNAFFSDELCPISLAN